MSSGGGVSGAEERVMSHVTEGQGRAKKWVLGAVKARVGM